MHVPAYLLSRLEKRLRLEMSQESIKTRFRKLLQTCDPKKCLDSEVRSIMDEMDKLWMAMLDKNRKEFLGG